MAIEANPAPAVPTPEVVMTRSLARAPKWLRLTALNVLSVLAWVGLPASLLSTLSSLQVVIDGALWLYRQAGLLRPTLRIMGEGIRAAVDAWRALTHPMWDALLSWLNLSLPAWSFDVLTLVALFALGFMRRCLRSARRRYAADNPPKPKGDRTVFHMYRLIPHPRDDENDRSFEVGFSYADLFCNDGAVRSERALADRHRIWNMFVRDHRRHFGLPSKDTAYCSPEPVLRAKFERYRRSVVAGRLDTLLYPLVAALIAFGMLIDGLYRGGMLAGG